MWRYHVHDRPSFGVVREWRPVGASDDVKFVHDNSIFYSGGQSQRIEIDAAGGDYFGVRQSGIEVLGDAEYAARLVVRIGPGIEGISVVLRDGAGELCRWDLAADGESQEWITHSGTMRPGRDSTATLEIVGRGRGTLWIGAVSLTRADRTGHARPDIADLVRNAGITSLRWPGGNFASDYHWRDGIGPADRRPTRLNRAWGEYEPNDFGTDEFLAFCGSTGAEASITVNAGSGGPGEAAAWVDYCNGPLDSEWGRRRADNGHPEPYNVRYWSIGNEMWGNFQVGHVDAETYARSAVEFARAMKAVDPSIHLTGVGHVRNTLGGWNERMVAAAGSSLDAISVHYYLLNAAYLEQEPEPDLVWDVVTAGAVSTGRMLRETIVVIDEHSTSLEPLTVSFDEWNVRTDLRRAPGWKEIYSLREGIYAAGLLNELQRLCDRVELAHQFSLVNRLGAIDATPNGVVQTPTFLALGLYQRVCGSTAIVAEVEVDGFDSPGLGTEPPLEGVPYLDVAATADVDGDRLVLACVNRHQNRNIDAGIEIDGFEAKPARITNHVLNGRAPLAGNTFSEPDAVAVQSSRQDIEWRDGSFNHVFPAHSVTLIELRRD